MENNYYQKHKERLRNEARKRYENLSEGEKSKGKKWPKKDIIVLLKKKKKKTGVKRIFLRNKSRS